MKFYARETWGLHDPQLKYRQHPPSLPPLRACVRACETDVTWMEDPRQPALGISSSKLSIDGLDSSDQEFVDNHFWLIHVQELLLYNPTNLLPDLILREVGTYGTSGHDGQNQNFQVLNIY